ncbi:hypothetical protein V6N12_055267 [Hibiscus sabdariffa]|uniref:Uncharacterized protein n=1 Tax=Hibiscus sabdariffa TaxID=183260 RepID=A0ABR2AV77_9ROSI
MDYSRSSEKQPAELYGPWMVASSRMRRNVAQVSKTRAGFNGSGSGSHFEVLQDDTPADRNEVVVKEGSGRGLDLGDRNEGPGLRAVEQQPRITKNAAYCWSEECTSVLELDHNHTGALMLRAQTLVTLKEYNSALFDVNRLIELNPSSEVYHNLQARLRTQVALTPIPESEEEFEEEEEEHGQPCTSEKGDEQDDGNEDIIPAVLEDLNAQLHEGRVKAVMISPKKPNVKKSSEREIDCKSMPEINTRVAAPQEPNSNVYPGIPEPESHSEQKNVSQRMDVPIEQGTKDSKGWQAIPKPKGHSALDYARWDKVQDDSSDDDEDDDEEDDSRPQYRFRVRTVGMRPVK